MAPRALSKRMRLARDLAAGVGDELRLIRDERLYEADGFSTFDEYLAERFGFGVAQADVFIAAAERRSEARRR
ncbi:MAG: hypothetical protein M3065_21805 [Actinomycetota bacterium]|nr:hypothetical protein [Actinomycetota bacterium]